MSNWYRTEGAPHPLGMSYVKEDDAYNFAIYSKHATSVKLLFYSDADYVNPVLAIDFDPRINKSQRVWHCRVSRSAVANATLYGYMVNGHHGDEPAFWHPFDPGKVLLDPYAKEIFFPPMFSRGAAASAGPNPGKAPLACLHTHEQEFDWQGDKSPRHEHDLIIYEMHVRGFTANENSGVEPTSRGTFQGVIEKIPYLRELGITAVELLPVHQYDPQENNYWGYMTLNFFSPHQSYAADRDHGGPIREFKTMVRELHRAGIEVILDVVYNHTTENDGRGPCYSFRGIDNSTYYLLNRNPVNPYENFSGTGNTLRSDHPAVQEMIMTSLRYWATEMHVDGFRFDLASVFSRRSDGERGESPIFANIASDPALANVRLIAEPWDAVGLYQLGRAFPESTWLQWNGAYRDDIRRFIKSDPGFTGVAMGRIYGSADLFPDDLFQACRPFQSVNYVNSHDGFTLYDQVAYYFKHNHDNGHDNTDGHGDNHSWNCGWEGDVNVPEAVMDLRRRQAKNFFTFLLMSNGTPMFLAGDEFLQTQNGNNNPYNQDNKTSWLNWDRLTQMNDHFRFVKKLIGFRRQHPSIFRSRFWRQDVRWYGVNSRDVDFGFENHSFALFVQGSAVNDNDIYVMINAHWDSRKFSFMEEGPWSRVIDTHLASPEDFPDAPEPVTTEYDVAGRSMAVFVK